MKSMIRSERGVAHLALIAIVVVAVVAAGAGFLVYSKKGPNDGKLKADAAGAYSSICGSGYNLKHSQGGNGFTLYNYKNASGRGCALVVNSNWGTAANLSVSATAQVNEFRRNVIASDSGRYKYYAGPIYYTHGTNIYLSGTKNGSNAYWHIQTN